VFTSSYISSEDAIWVKKDRNDIHSIKDFSGRTIAVEENYYNHEYFKNNHKDAQFFLVSSTFEALKAVSEGKADVYMGTLAVGSYIIEQNLLNNLKILQYI